MYVYKSPNELVKLAKSRKLVSETFIQTTLDLQIDINDTRKGISHCTNLCFLN